MLTEDDLNLITFINQQYAITGEILSAEQAEAKFGVPAVKYANALGNKEVRAALEKRGIVFQRFEKDDWTSKSLTPLQLITANSLLDLTDTRSQKKKLQDLSVGTQTYNAWLKDPVFKDYIHKRAEQLIGENQHEVDTALLDQVRAGNLKAIEYYNEMTGRFVRQRANAASVDVTNLLVRIMEIIDEHVLDVDTKLILGAEFKKLAAARNMATALTTGSMDNDPIVVPEVVKIRALTDGNDE